MGVGAVDDAVSELFAARVLPRGPMTLTVDVGAVDDAVSELFAARVFPRGPMTLTVDVGAGNDADTESRAFRIPGRGLMTDGTDSELRAISIAPMTRGPVVSIVASCAWKVVEATGQPCPDPLRFCSVSVAALMRASWDAVELSSGKEIGTDGVLTTCPAATFAFRL